MATAHLGEIPPGTKHCKVCKEPINKDAWKCIHCSAEQGPWRSRLTLSATMMSLAVALVSVLGATAPALKAMMTPENSNLSFAFQGATNDHIILMVTNKGIRPGSFRAGALTVSDGNQEYQLVLHIVGSEPNEPVIVKAAESLLIKMHARNKFEGLTRRQTCAIAPRYVDFLGAVSETKLNVNCNELSSFVSAHSS